MSAIRFIRTTIPWMFAVLITAMAAAFGWRMILLYKLFDGPSGCGECVVFSAAINDSPFLLAWLAVTWFGFTSSSKLLALLCRFGSGLSLVIYAADVYILGSFYTRLYYRWAVEVGTTPGVVLDHILSSGIIDVVLLGLAVCIILATLVTRPRKLVTPSAVYAVFTVMFITGLIASRLENIDYVHAWAAENVFMTSQFSGLSRDYSGLDMDDAKASIGEIPECRPGRNARRDIIILILESWSSYQSHKWGGAKNWTPSLDMIFDKSIANTRFIAGGFTTNQGLMSIISGIPIISPLTSLFEWKAFEPSWGWQYTLPGQLEDGGYQTAFLTSGNLSFAEKGGWIEHTGFSYIEGSDYSGYAGHPRSHFDAVPDEVLFDRAVSYWKDHVSKSRPMALMIESVSSHTPFKHPLTGEIGEESVMRYMDRAAGNFVDRLEAEDYFSSGGILLLVSDHRSMTVLNDHEVESFGAWAPGLIPFLLRGFDMAPRPTDFVYHQSDIAASLAGYLTERGCGYPGWRSLFEIPEDTENRCVFHASGTDWEKLHVFCDKGHGVIALDGDDSRFLESHELSKQRRDHILKTVAYFRTVTQENSQSYLQKKL